MTVDVRPAPSGAVDVTAAQALLIEDWLGFADYLAEAVSGGAATVDDARVELAAAASGILERHALECAADEARHRVDEPLTAELLRWATNHANRSAAA